MLLPLDECEAIDWLPVKLLDELRLPAADDEKGGREEAMYELLCGPAMPRTRLDGRDELLVVAEGEGDGRGAGSACWLLLLPLVLWLLLAEFWRSGGSCDEV